MITLRARARIHSVRSHISSTSVRTTGTDVMHAASPVFWYLPRIQHAIIIFSSPVGRCSAWDDSFECFFGANSLLLFYRNWSFSFQNTIPSSIDLYVVALVCNACQTAWQLSQIQRRDRWIERGPKDGDGVREDDKGRKKERAIETVR